MKIEKENTIISLTGSNPLYEKAINKLREKGLIVYLDIDKEEILKRCQLMKVTRIVGQNTKTLNEILDYRRNIYEKYYDIRIIIGKSDTPEEITEEIIKAIYRDQRYISTRQIQDENTKYYSFENVLSKGLADDKGLFLPLHYPYFRLNQYERLVKLSYQERYQIYFKKIFFIFYFKSFKNIFILFCNFK